jgi:hypothetical protein
LPTRHFPNPSYVKAFIMFTSRCLHHAYTKRLLPTSTSSAALPCRSSSSKALVLHTRQLIGRIPATVEDRLGIAQGRRSMSQTSCGNRISCCAASTRLPAGSTLGHCHVQPSTERPTSHSTGHPRPVRCFSSAPSAGTLLALSAVRVLCSRELRADSLRPLACDCSHGARRDDGR